MRRWDWRTTSLTHIDDYSHAYLPQMEKETGRQTGLNLEVVK